MTTRLLWALAAAALLALPSGGCVGLDRYYEGNCHHAGLSGRNGVGCCGSCGHQDCDGGCGDGGCADGSCGSGPSCGGCGACGACCPHPLKTLFRALHCSSGCGEFYYDEWINDPPERCDPCNNHGAYIGPQGTCQRWFQGMRGQRGYHCGCDTSCGIESGCGAPGCTSCGHGGHSHGDVEVGEIEDIAPQPMQPTPAAETARRPNQAYYTPKTTRVAQTKPAPQARVISSSTRTARLQEPTPAERPVGSGARTLRR